MAQSVRMSEFARRLADHVNRVAYRGESFQILRAGRPVAEVRPVRARSQLRELAALLAALPRLSADDTLGFSRDLEAARADLVRRAFRDPWAS